MYPIGIPVLELGDKGMILIGDWSGDIGDIGDKDDIHREIEFEEESPHSSHIVLRELRMNLIIKQCPSMKLPMSSIPFCTISLKYKELSNATNKTDFYDENMQLSINQGKDTA